MSLDLDESYRSEPAKVYPAPEVADRWIVEAPRMCPPAGRQPVQFNGPNAFGSARFFPF